MIAVKDLIALFWQALNEGWGYVWGTAGIVWTAAKQKAATREMTVKYGSKWIGKTVADCSGLFAWAFKQLGGYMYHGSNTMWNKYCTAQGELKNGKRTDGQPLKPGTAVFQKTKKNGTVNRGHVGLYVGNGTVIEAHGTKAGVITSDVSGWAEWGELKGVDYSGAGDDSYTPSVPAGKLDGECYVDVPNDGTVNMRASKSTGGKIITTVREGEFVDVISDDGEWCEVEYVVRKTGYIMSRYLRKE